MSKIEGSSTRATARPTGDAAPAAAPTAEDAPSLDEIAPESGSLPSAGDIAVATTIVGGAPALQGLYYASTLGDDALVLAKNGLSTSSSTLASGTGTALNAVGAGAVAIDKLENSTAETTLGRAVDATGSGVLFYALGTNPATGGFLAIDSMAEMTIEAGVRAVAGEDVNVKVGIGTHLNSSVSAVVTLGELMFTDDHTGAKEFSEKAANGELGLLMQMANYVGEKADWGFVFDRYFFNED